MAEDSKTKIMELRKHHQDVFDSLGIPDAYFYPKMAYKPSGKSEMHISFFPSEFRKESDIYTEFVSREFISEDVNRSLWKWRYNPHWETEYEATTNDPNTVRYLVPTSELIKINTQPKSEKSIIGLKMAAAKGKDAPLAELTIKDFAAIILKKKISDKSWLNDLID